MTGAGEVSFFLEVCARGSFYKTKGGGGVVHFKRGIDPPTLLAVINTKEDTDS